MSEELSESENTGKHRKTRWERTPRPPRGLWINHLLALTRSVRLSAELRLKRTRRSREVTSRRRSDAELKFRNPPPATRRCLKCSPLGSSLVHSKKLSLPVAAESSPLLGHAWQTECCLNSTLKPSLKIIGGRINHRKFFFPPPWGMKIRELNFMCNVHRAARKMMSSKMGTIAKAAKKSAKSWRTTSCGQRPGTLWKKRRTGGNA